MTPVPVALLLVHAFPLDARMWDAEVAAFEGNRTVLAPSLPGFGGTPGVGEILTVEAMADFLAGELDRAGADRAVVAGCSMGGYAALALRRRHPERVAGLGLVDTRAEPDDEDARGGRRAVAELVSARGSAAIAENPPPLLSPGAGPGLWERVKRIIGEQPPAAIAAASLGMAERPDSRPLLPEIDVPVAVVVGSEDRLTPPALAEEMAGSIPDAVLTVLDGAGHVSNLEAPGPFADALQALLERSSA